MGIFKIRLDTAHSEAESTEPYRHNDPEQSNDNKRDNAAQSAERFSRAERQTRSSDVTETHLKSITIQPTS